MQTLAVEIAPPTAPLSLRQALLDVCTRASRDTACVETPEGSDSVWVATVSWMDSAHAHVEVSERASAVRAIRDVSFGTRDPVEERWRAVGLVIGTLAFATSKPEAALPSSPVSSGTLPLVEPKAKAPADVAKPAPRPESPAPATTPPPVLTAAVEVPVNVDAKRAPPQFFLDIGATLGSALTGGPVRLGGEVAGRARLASSGVQLGLGASYSVSANRWHDLHTAWTEAFLGLSLERRLSRVFASNVHAEGLVERFEVDVDDSRAEATKSRMLGGVRMGADLFCWVTDAFGVFAGGSGRWVSGTTDIAVDGTRSGTAPPFGYVVRVGVSYGLR